MHGLKPLARILGMASAGVPPRIMGIGPVPAVTRLCERLGVKAGDYDVVELNEAFASQALACLRQLGLPDDGEHINPNGGAIAIGHPLGMSGARIAGAAVSFIDAPGAMHSPPCASASARASRWRSNASDSFPRQQA